MQAIRQLKQGDLVGIFPEGGINRGLPGVKAANPGVAFLALSTKAPVYPCVYLWIADRQLDVDESVPHLAHQADLR